MQATPTRHWFYRLAAFLAGVYLIYVLSLKLAARATGGPLGELGEFLLVLAAVASFSIGLFIDEARAAASAAATKETHR